MKRLRTIALLLLFPCLLFSQDTTKLTLQQFLSLVNKNHPIAKQAGLINDENRFTIRTARGAFDPVIGLDADRKELKGIEYFTHQDYFVKVPLLPGIDLKGGHERNQGEFLNPESNTPIKGLTYAGVSVPLGRGLFFDERRNALKQAHLAAEANVAKRTEMINKLLLNAIKTYADWYLSYKSLQKRQEALDIAQFRLKGTVIRIREGDVAAIDSTEAWVEVQKRKIDLLAAQNDYVNNSLLLSVFLWTEENEPLQISDKIIPADSLSVHRLKTLESKELTERLNTASPLLLSQSIRIRQLNSERRLSIELIKPQVNLSYNILYSGIPTNSEYASTLRNNNYKAGVSIYVPIFLRKERGNLSLINLKIQQAKLEQQSLQRELLLQGLANINSFKNTLEQLTLQQSLVNNSDVLRRGEVTRFESGESNLFMVNIRENRVIEAELKLYEIEAKALKAHAEALFITASLEGME